MKIKKKNIIEKQIKSVKLKELITVAPKLILSAPAKIKVNNINEFFSLGITFYDFF